MCVCALRLIPTPAPATHRFVSTHACTPRHLIRTPAPATAAPQAPRHLMPCSAPPGSPPRQTPRPAPAAATSAQPPAPQARTPSAPRSPARQTDTCRQYRQCRTAVDLQLCPRVPAGKQLPAEHSLHHSSSKQASLPLCISRAAAGGVSYTQQPVKATDPSCHSIRHTPSHQVMQYPPLSTTLGHTPHHTLVVCEYHTAYSPPAVS